MTGPQGKAAGFISLVAVLRDFAGEDGWPVLASKLSAETLELVENPPLPMSWIDDVHYAGLYGAAEEVLGTDRLYDVGVEQMRRDMSTVYKVLVKLASPASLVRRAAAIYGTYTNMGSMVADQVESRKIRVELEGVTGRDAAFWEYQRGTIAGVFAFSRVKVFEVTLVEGGGDTDGAVYTITW